MYEVAFGGRGGRGGEGGGEGGGIGCKVVSMVLPLQLESICRVSETEWKMTVVLPSVSFAPLILPSQESVRDLEALEICMWGEGGGGKGSGGGEGGEVEGREREGKWRGEEGEGKWRGGRGRGSGGERRGRGRGEEGEREGKWRGEEGEREGKWRGRKSGGGEGVEGKKGRERGMRKSSRMDDSFIFSLLQLLGHFR